MNILFLCRFLPHPTVRDSGGQDTFHYIAALSEHHAISLLSFAGDQEYLQVQEMARICAAVYTVPYSATALSGRLWRAGWRSFLPKVYGRVVSPRYRLVLRQLTTRTRFDVVVVDGMMADYGRFAPNSKRILDEVDIYFVSAYHAYASERQPLKRARALMDWLYTTRRELGYVRSYDGVVTRSKMDTLFLQTLVPAQRISVLAPWFEGLTDAIQSIPPQRPPNNQLLFVGAMGHPKNVAAVTFFAQQIFPLVRQCIPDATFWIVGGNPALAVQALAAVDGVVVTGAVEDLTPYYDAAALNVVPLLTGGGIITKTLNGLAAARPTVATSFGVSGIVDAAEHGVIVADQPDAFAGAIVHLLTDEHDWLAAAARGRAFIRAHYDWHDIMHSFESFIQSVL